MDTSASMIYQVRKQLVEEGFEAVLSRKRRMTPPVAAIFDGEKEAKLIALACSKPPKERARWTLRLLESKVVELGIVERASDSTIGRTLKKNCLKPHRRQCWVIPPKANSAFVAAMEDVLAVYTRPHNPDYPLVCLDETSKQLVAEMRTPIPMKRGRTARIDYEYERNGTANLFMLFAPLEGWRHVEVTDRHRRATGATVWTPLHMLFLADAHARLGHFGDARRCIDEAMTAVETTNEKWCDAEVNRVAGEIALQLPEPNAAEAQSYFKRALAVARQQQAKSWELRAAMSLARLWRDQGKTVEARELLAPVYGWFTEGFDTLDLKEAKALLEGLGA